MVHLVHVSAGLECFFPPEHTWLILIFLLQILCKNQWHAVEGISFESVRYCRGTATVSFKSIQTPTTVWILYWNFRTDQHKVMQIVKWEKPYDLCQTFNCRMHDLYLGVPLTLVISLAGCFDRFAVVIFCSKWLLYLSLKCLLCFSVFCDVARSRTKL